MIIIMPTIKCNMPRTITTNNYCNTKTKIDHAGIRNLYANFELVERRLINQTKQLSALGRGYVWSQYSGSNPTSRQEVHTIYNEVHCANSNLIKQDLKPIVILDYNKRNKTIEHICMALDRNDWRNIVRRVVLQK